MEELFGDKIETYVIDNITGRVKEYMSAADEIFTRQK